MDEKSGSASGLTIARLLPPTLIAVVCGVLFNQTRHFALLGYDTYPIILTSRVQSLADFFGNFTEKLMDGRYTSDFYRPLLNLTFAWDHAVWGLEPIGYQVTNLAIFAACAWMLFALARRIFGEESRFGPYVVLLTFLLNPLQFEVLPVAPRRPEVLACLFMALSIRLQLAPRALRSTRPPIGPAVTLLLALVSKESAFVLPALSFLAVWLFSPRERGLDRLRHAATAMIPHVAVVIGVILVRLAVLGGLGGHVAMTPGEIVTLIPRAIGHIAATVMLPQPPMESSILGRGLVILLVLGLATTVILQLGRRPEEGKPEPKMPRALDAIVFAGAWILIFGLLYPAAGLIGPWYMFLPVAGWALFVGGMTELLVAFARDEGRTVRVSATVTLALLAAVLLWHTRYSPTIHHYDEWNRATSVGNLFLDQCRRQIDAGVEGTVVTAPAMPGWVRAREDVPTVRGAAIFAEYSIQAWAELTIPERKVRVHGMNDGTPIAAPDEVLLLITKRLAGY